MSQKSIEKIAVVIPNLNGEKFLSEAINSLLTQSINVTIVVVENASTDSSIDILKSYGDSLIVLENEKNLGFAGGVNVGIKYAVDNGFEAVALFNNDAVADPKWIENLISDLNTHPDTGIVTCRMMLGDSQTLDSTGEFYTSWGLPYPRGREKKADSYMEGEYIFGASGGASLYRIQLFKEVGLFDETFFAYYEDTDISFRAQLAGWKVRYNPSAVVYHRQGATSKRMARGFTVYQTFKNLPMLFTKNVPASLLFSIGCRFYFAYFLIFAKAIVNGNGIPAVKGLLKAVVLAPHSLKERRRIQRNKKVTDNYINSIIIHDLPPDQTGIRKLRKVITGKY